MLTATILSHVEKGLKENSGPYSQNELAKRIGINPSLLCRWRQGREPSSETLDKAFKWAGLSITKKKQR